jgi:hypothetical protein
VIHWVHEDATDVDSSSGSRLKEADSTGKEGRASGIGFDSKGDSGISKQGGEVMAATSIRQKLVAYMARYGFAPAMCENKTSDQLLHIAAMLVQHRQYQGLLEADEIIRLGEMEKLVAELRQVN